MIKGKVALAGGVISTMKTWQYLKQNPEAFERYFVKEYVIKAARKFFEHRNYHELESPIITSALPQERFLDVLETDIELKNKVVKGYIVPTTETFNKKILAAGLGEHFVITKVCRGLEEIGPNHSPEFTMLEWYHLDASYFDLMDDCEELIKFMLKLVKIKSKGKNKFELTFDEINNFNIDLRFEYQDKEIDLGGKWNRLSVADAFEKILGVNLSEVQDEDKFRTFAKSKGYNISDEDSWQIIFEFLFASEIEPTLAIDKPTFVYDYPKQVCVLTKPNEKNSLVCEKVELYIAGKELANGYTELLDWELQEKRFLEEQAARKSMGLKEVKYDQDLIDALKSGLPDVAGIGMGLDRLAMIFANAKYISEINYFPASEMFEE